MNWLGKLASESRDWISRDRVRVSPEVPFPHHSPTNEPLKMSIKSGASLVLVACAMLAVTTVAPGEARAQRPESSDRESTSETSIVGADELRALAEDSQGGAGDVEEPEPSGVDMLSLIARGGGFMIPIGLMSFFVVALSIERLFSLRTGKVFPRKLERRLREMARSPDRFGPSEAYHACRSRKSPAGRVIASMLLRTGQPLGDIERTASEAAQREADALIGPVRWLNLAAAATPLMGLLGTVWGMIMAFHESTTLTAGRSRSEQLSEGIYTALVTTLAGLAVAIPAAILAQYLENRVSKHFRRIELMAFDVAPGLARFAGKVRLDPDGSLKRIGGSPRSGTEQNQSEQRRTGQKTESKEKRGPAKAT